MVCGMRKPPSQYHVCHRKYVYSGATYQQVDIVDTYIYDRCLILDGKIQSSRMDEHIYHEALVHPAVVLYTARRVLVMGGGRGCFKRAL